MKTIILSLLLLSASTSFSQTGAKRTNNLVRFLAENSFVRNMGLQSLMNNRCKTYFSYFEAIYCQEILSYMMGHLDIDIIVPQNKTLWRPSSFVFVAFKKDFLEILNSPQTANFLRRANEQLSQHIVNERADANLWSLALSYYGDKYEASKVMAALFQDTSNQRLHIGYIYLSKIRKSKVFIENQELLERLLSTIHMILDYREDDYQKIFYPRELKEELNRNIYHFYVPLYLSMKLKRMGVQNKYAVMAPFMMTLSYEFITYGKGADNLYSDPLIITREGTVKDIFGGYCGANYGVFGNAFRRNYRELKYNLSRSTHLAIDELFRYY
ncbi:MAG: hypothetical protein WCY48_10440 [Candidatus Caldatribacteriota bacterium]